MTEGKETTKRNPTEEFSHFVPTAYTHIPINFVLTYLYLFFYVAAAVKAIKTNHKMPSLLVFLGRRRHFLLVRFFVF